VSEVPEEVEELIEVSAVEEEIMTEPQVVTKLENGATKSHSAMEEEEELDSPLMVNGVSSDSSALSEEQVKNTEAELQVKASTEHRELEVTKDLSLNAPEEVSEMVKSISAADNQAVELV